MICQRGEFAPFDDTNSLSPRRRPPPRPSDPAQHTGDPPVARHDDLTDDPTSLVVVGPRVEAAQGLEVAAAEAVTTATVLAAVAVVIQVVLQLESDFSLQRTQEQGQGYDFTHDKCQSSTGKGRRRGGGGGGGGGGRRRRRRRRRRKEGEEEEGIDEAALAVCQHNIHKTQTRVNRSEEMSVEMRSRVLLDDCDTEMEIAGRMGRA